MKPLFFWFTDAPRRNDKWETELDIDVLIHTRPPLIAQRDRYARTYGTWNAAQELQIAVIRGLKAYGYAALPPLYELVYERLDSLIFEALGDMIVAHCALFDDPESKASFAARESFLLEETLDSPEMVARFVKDHLTQLSELDSVDRMRRIYSLRGAQLGQSIPFSQNASDILARAFGGDDVIVRFPGPMEANGASVEEALGDVATSPMPPEIPEIKTIHLSKLHDEVFVDIMAGLNRRLVDSPLFLDRILVEWVVPRLDRRFEELDEDIERLLENSLVRSSRQEHIYRMTAKPEWLALAEELGSPVPEPDPPTEEEPCSS